jgi:hypothetical protein
MLSSGPSLGEVPVGAGLDLGQRLVRPISAVQTELLNQIIEHLRCFHAGVPDVEVRHGGQPGHLCAVTGDCLENDAGSLLVGKAPITTGDGQAGGQALQVPLPGTRQRLVEVVA